ncbi:GNAT family N-acetyltransferase [Celeribacter indicus]|uniref:Putative N-acetyltransferase n=1 Tax=Celeribacter indicus TaxID=1208324 RepID=A0A0B5E1K7_9RHOB|nr:GNAT family N-acetyltransferase [Celeribacter indicus]AJE47285.1 putative N-acetyltransferase [Celeribacter indicus]SDW02454.1 Acetyltransferase (GNAT) domain-containing protein [Celeribacter indicus]
MTVTLATEPDLSAGEFVALLEASTLAERRPVGDPDRIAAMLAGADLIVTARDGTRRLVGVARSVTDFAYCLYCSELAVAADRQGEGLGKALLAETVRVTPRVKTHLLIAAPKAVGFYERAGYLRTGDCFIFHRGA